jgi:glutamyl-Q tRNA(Asp) synthetase
MTGAADRRRVVGRFAPTPSGPLHLGSLLAAVGSWLDAHQAGGEWLLRIDDLDRPRCRPEHEHAILAALAAHGLTPDRPPARQSGCPERYDAALRALDARGLLFRCSCSRRELAASGGGEPCCLRDCRRRPADAAGPDASQRIDLTGLAPMQVVDRSLGPIEFAPARHRDVVVRRRDGIVAYALTAVVDDHAAGVTDVVRGGDLLAGTPWQLALHQALGLTPPRYLHLPVVTEPDGTKLAKSRRSLPLDPDRATADLTAVLGWLRQPPPPEDTKRSAAELLAAAALVWDPGRFAGEAQVRLAG